MVEQRLENQLEFATRHSETVLLDAQNGNEFIVELCKIKTLNYKAITPN